MLRVENERLVQRIGMQLARRFAVQEMQEVRGDRIIVRLAIDAAAVAGEVPPVQQHRAEARDQAIGDVARLGRRVAFALGSQRWLARVKVQTVPQSDPSAWLIAEVARPDGVWPDGSLQLVRGAQVVGRSVWRTGERAQIALSVGRDEQVRVQNLPVTQQTASAGFIGNRTERRVGRLVEVETRRRTPVTLEVLESTPVSTDEKITVTRQFSPAPQPGDWQDQPGVVAWTQTLAPGQKARFSAEYLISHAKELQVIERR